MIKSDSTKTVKVGTKKKFQKRSFWRRAKLELKKSPWTARFGMIVILSYIIIAVFAPWLAPYGESQVFPVPYEPWGKEFVFGTDQIGRDILSRMIFGARNTVGIAIATTLLAFLIGGALGLAAAINRAWLDQALSRFVDVLMAIPSLIFALVLLSIFGTSILNLIVIIAVLDATRVFRLTRAVSLNVVVMDSLGVSSSVGLEIEDLNVNDKPTFVTNGLASSTTKETVLKSKGVPSVIILIHS